LSYRQKPDRSGGDRHIQVVCDCQRRLGYPLMVLSDRCSKTYTFNRCAERNKRFVGSAQAR
jgi:hypothetical protein